MSIRLIASAISGVTTALFTLPFDNVKTKIMKQKKGISYQYSRSGWKVSLQWIFGLL